MKLAFGSCRNCTLAAVAGRRANAGVAGTPMLSSDNPATTMKAITAIAIRSLNAAINYSPE